MIADQTAAAARTMKVIEAIRLSFLWGNTDSREWRRQFTSLSFHRSGRAVEYPRGPNSCRTGRDQGLEPFVFIRP
jgi:hypothetical protein